MSWPSAWNTPDTSASTSWSSPSSQGNRHPNSAVDGSPFLPHNLPELHSPQMPPMSRMQSFSAMADLELARMNDVDAEVPGHHLRAQDCELRTALARLLRAETAFDFAATVADADAAARSARPEDRERVAELAAAASARRRAAQRAADHHAHIVEAIREPVPVEGQEPGQLAMEIVGYVGVTGNRDQGQHEGASTSSASWDWE